MFDSSLITDNKDAFFYYMNSKGEVSKQSIVHVVEKDDYFQGYSLTRKAYRTFRKDRVVEMYATEAKLYNSDIVDSTHKIHSVIKTNKKKPNTGLEICFTGFSQADKSRLKDIALSNSMSVKGDVSAKLYFLCVGDNKGWRKIEKAREKNAFIITEKQFLHFIETGEIPYEAPEIDNLYEEKITSETDNLKQMVEELSLNFKTLRESRRSTALIANFIDGYAAGWTFAVKETFKSALDIKRTKITFEGIVYDAWTQGSSYQFQRGDTFYSDKLGYSCWERFLELPQAVVLQIKYDCYSGYETIASFEGILTGEFNPNRLITPKSLEAAPILMEYQSYDPGTITVEMLVPDDTKKRLKTIEEITMTQDDFISLLQSGCYWRKKTGETPEYVSLLNYDRS